jgi:hypothetical protein
MTHARRCVWSARYAQFFTIGVEGRPFDSARDELVEAVLEATLSDCKRVSDAIMHAVHWDNPELIEEQLVCRRRCQPAHRCAAPLTVARHEGTWRDAR